ncbi:hypothetical protein CONPUDRAFT_52649 [Coniophora puteana RWD-64-598 SS2]|uniref:SNF2 family DNA-dependent ATPase n=1 Tax=Coniophora puteana (strain RWD-64-598) TaxID=741705 RepID=A0A5M3MUV6_CONPW|nr:uncharacterized protein CONPUDRAFT_52649 [Coniophora puteana RWD-64-598 SS2]EIW82919.1 hypothetical protein CONPUDRAFT_52649 [Coniophora puteana RWD-64-598 SS2]
MSVSSEESSTPAASSRIVRGQHGAVAVPEGDSPDLKKFIFIHPERPQKDLRAAWKQAGGDEKRADSFLNDHSWRPPRTTPPISITGTQASPAVVTASPPQPPEITGRVEELDEAHKAERAAMREKAKKSSIYANRVTLDTDDPLTTPSSSKVQSAIPTSPTSPATPALVMPRRKRTKKVIVDSDEESGDEEIKKPSRLSRVPNKAKAKTPEDRALAYFNDSTEEGLQELTGCTADQAKKISEHRPFDDEDDLRVKLAQGGRKAGPGGISPRMFDDCVAMFKGYGHVDSVLESVERIGDNLRAAIASWTLQGSVESGKGKQKEEDATQDVLTKMYEADDGSLSLRTLRHVKASADYLTQQPKALPENVKLKDYQLLGVNWLYLLYRKELSCILADEMGLGKTIQVISFLAHLQEHGRHGPHLVVVPSSTLENWCREFARFAPSIAVQTYYADKNERSELRQTLYDSQWHRNSKGKGWEVLITTYNLAQGDERDRKFFRRMEWDCCIFDEGHVLKNFESQRYKALLKYESNWRLLLTGTPLQNNLQELVVLKDLPNKTERIEWCEMTPMQKSIYNDALARSRKIIREEAPTPDGADESAQTNGRGKAKKKSKSIPRGKDERYLENSANVLMDLRKATSHPMLFRKRFTDQILDSVTRQLLKEPDFKKRGAIFDYVKEDMEVMTDAELQFFCQGYKKFLQNEKCYLEAGKVTVLLKLLKRYQASGRKILIFSQFTQILDILQAVLKQQKTRYLLLTGATAVDLRQTLVDEFTEDDTIPIFLLSTKAGGMGINLTAASVVIMFDQDWNPHNDRQAHDRAYRIGQKRDVEVVKLITRGTIEEDILRLGETKLALDEAVAGDADDVDDKQESTQEQAMKMSLMNVLRKQFAEQQGTDSSTPASSDMPEVEMDDS